MMSFFRFFNFLQIREVEEIEEKEKFRFEFVQTHLATVRKASSTFKPVLADVSKNDTLYSRANRSPSSLRTSRSGQSALLPKLKYFRSFLGRNKWLQ